MWWFLGLWSSNLLDSVLFLGEWGLHHVQDQDSFWARGWIFWASLLNYCDYYSLSKVAWRFHCLNWDLVPEIFVTVMYYCWVECFEKQMKFFINIRIIWKALKLRGGNWEGCCYTHRKNSPNLQIFFFFRPLNHLKKVINSLKNTSLTIK